jgi:hypothetical protein
LTHPSKIPPIINHPPICNELFFQPNRKELKCKLDLKIPIQFSCKCPSKCKSKVIKKIKRN